MPLSLKDVTTQIVPRANHIVIYSIGGVGKTTMGVEITKTEKGVMLLTGEDSLSPLKVSDVPHISIGCNVNPENIDELVGAWKTYKDYLKLLICEKHDYQTIVQDPLTSLTNALDGYVVKTFYNGNEKEAANYGSKYNQYLSEFNSVIEAYKVLLNKGINIYTFCHGAIVDAKDPSTEKYNKWDISLPAGLKISLPTQLFNHADAVLFGCYDISVSDDKAKGGTKRILKTQGEASYVAKNRFSLPEKILFNYKVLKDLITPKKVV